MNICPMMRTFKNLSSYLEGFLGIHTGSGHAGRNKDSFFFNPAIGKGVGDER